MTGAAFGITIWALYAALVVVPFWHLLPAHGWPKHMAVIAVFPILAVFLLWLVAFGHKLDPGDR
jgi:hypothetical protein